MNPTDFTTRIHTKAQHVANHLNALTPYERSLVLHEAQSIWDECDARRLPESDETDITATAAWIGSKLRDISPEFRIELVHLIEGMSNSARLNWLMGEDEGDF